MKKLVIICLAVTAMSVLKAEAFDWTVLSKLFTPAVTTTTETVQTNAKDEAIAALNDIQKQANEIDKTVQDNFASIITMISAKKEARRSGGGPVEGVPHRLPDLAAVGGGAGRDHGGGVLRQDV